jgi:hypothetical protein
MRWQSGNIFFEGPSITNDGILRFTPRQFKSGSTECTVILKDGVDGLKVTEPLTIVVADGE